VRTTRVWRRVHGVEHTVIESVELESDGRGGECWSPRCGRRPGATRRCSRCQRRCPGYDTSPTVRRWRGPEVGSTQVFLRATARRCHVRGMAWWSRRCLGAARVAGWAELAA
jgi:transposase